MARRWQRRAHRHALHACEQHNQLLCLLPRKPEAYLVHLVRGGAVALRGGGPRAARTQRPPLPPTAVAHCSGARNCCRELGVLVPGRAVHRGVVLEQRQREKDGGLVGTSTKDVPSAKIALHVSLTASVQRSLRILRQSPDLDHAVPPSRRKVPIHEPQSLDRRRMPVDGQRRML